jgi:hypothetical protein
MFVLLAIQEQLKHKYWASALVAPAEMRIAND